MGIKNLNRFFKTNAASSITQLNLNALSGKKIVIDTSIYMHKFIGTNELIEKMYLMISTLRYYNIIPLFIFDGKAPIEKQELLRKRRENKQNIENEYNKLKYQLSLINPDNTTQTLDLMNKIKLLKKDITYIDRQNIEKVKKLFDAYGISYYDAINEADELCSMLTIRGDVWACLSEDMDMFVYGCPRVIRYLSLLNHSCVLYDLTDILSNLGITQKQLREICVLSGTDYNINDYVLEDNKITEPKMSANGNTTYKYKNDGILDKSLKYFKQYKKKINKIEDTNTHEDFYTWLNNNTSYIKDYDVLINIYKMFDITPMINDELYKNIKIEYSAIISHELNDILKLDGFVFPN